MKRSKAVPLLMLGTLGLIAGCGQSQDIQTRQNSYRSVEDCRKDWGNDEKDCTRGTARSGGGFVYMGPRYIWNHGGGVPMAVNPDGTQRALPNSYLNRPGSVSTATHATVSRTSVGSGARSSGFSGSRGGFGGTAHGFSGGG